MTVSSTSKKGTENEPITRTAEISVPKPNVTAKGIAIAAGLWTLYTLLLATIITQTEDAPFLGALLGQSIESAIMALVSVPVWWLVVRQMEDWHWGWIVATHLLIAPLYSWGTVAAFLVVIRAGAPPETVTALEARAPWLALTHFTLYAIQFALYHLIRSLKRLRLQEQQASDLLARAQEQELAALKAQINPHFLFNTLNSISATLKKDPGQAREMIAKLAGLMRYALDCSNQDRVPLRDEVDFVRRYLALERHRFSDRLEATVTVEAKDSTLDTPVPPMVLQPLVENALRHGIAPSETGGRVSLTVSETQDRVTVRVADTGVGLDADRPLSADDEGTGLSNTNARLKRTYGPNAALQTAPNDPTGFVVWFSLPRTGTPRLE